MKCSNNSNLRKWRVSVTLLCNYAIYCYADEVDVTYYCRNGLEYKNTKNRYKTKNTKKCEKVQNKLSERHCSTKKITEKYCKALKQKLSERHCNYTRPSFFRNESPPPKISYLMCVMLNEGKSNGSESAEI